MFSRALGKTLQAICILAGDHHQRMSKKEANLPSLVICPPTLTGHWVYEVNKFVSTEYLKPLHYVGFPNDREKLRPKIAQHNLVVVSLCVCLCVCFRQLDWFREDIAKIRTAFDSLFCAGKHH